MQNAAVLRQIKSRYRGLAPLMDERMRRQWAATEAQTYGRGGVSAVSSATGMSRNTIRKGLFEVAARKRNPRLAVAARIRKQGGGRKRLTETDPGMAPALDRLIEPTTRGDPMSPLRWTCKSTMNLAHALTRHGHPVGAWTVGAMMKQSGYSLQSNRKTKEGGSHPDRNAQFAYIHGSVEQFQQRGQPVISVDTKKKELVGPFKNGGREWQPKGEPEEVVIHDFVDEQLGKVIPYGVFDLSLNEGWVSVGIDHDTAQFAVQAIGRWWHKMGTKRYPRARALLITADGGGSNGSRCRLWKVALQKLANDIDLKLTVCHFPPGTSKWNKVEHKLFCFITNNWRGKPLISHQVIVNLIAGTKTTKGLTVKAALDTQTYETGIKVTDDQLAALKITPATFHGNWNYRIRPHR